MDGCARKSRPTGYDGLIKGQASGDGIRNTSLIGRAVKDKQKSKMNPEKTHFTEAVWQNARTSYSVENHYEPVYLMFKNKQIKGKSVNFGAEMSRHQTNRDG
jgi:hypothetical protein